jgi:hypothetical protein
MQTIAALAMEWVCIVFLGGLGALILYKILVGQIDLTGLLTEPPPAAVAAAVPAGAIPPAIVPYKASMSRLQFLLFTFVIAGLYLTLSLEAGTLVEIPNQVLGLLGISGGSYVIAKGIQANS